MRKLMILVAALAALGVVAVSASAASAAPHWYVEGEAEPIEEGVEVEVLTSSVELRLTDEKANAELTCTVTDAGTVENPPGGGAGVDTITAFSNPECGLNICLGTATTLASGFPWHSELYVDEDGVIRDRIEGIVITIFCDGGPIAQYSGTLTPRILGSNAIFDAGSGFLTSTGGTHGVVNGTDHLEGVVGEGITAHNP
jgi:hypothetical protein